MFLTETNTWNIKAMTGDLGTHKYEKLWALLECLKPRRLCRVYVRMLGMLPISHCL